uniref:Type IV secretion system protein virB3 n=1 Tax=Klebsiella pneumoniae TaxID=573 RepID=A0A649Z5G9_KLEPN|nr:Type IV secretion system protein virB3 [Klebsiella pneumoniae]
MSTVFKGLTRPALIRGLGVPLYPFLGMCVICVLLGVWIHEAMYALILPGWYAIKRVTKIDERFFDLLYLRMQIKGNPLAKQALQCRPLCGEFVRRSRYIESGQFYEA